MDPIVLNEKKYVVYFEDRGFYAQHQPNYHWSYTQDLRKAKKYNSLKGASVRAQNALDVRKHILHQRELGNISCGMERKNVRSNWIEEDAIPTEPQIFEVTSEGLTNTSPIPMVKIQSKLQRDMEKRALSPEFLQSLMG